jgi:hypothetical protein
VQCGYLGDAAGACGEIADTSRGAVETAFEALPAGQGHIVNLTAAVMALNSYPLAIEPMTTSLACTHCLAPKTP